MRAVSNGPGETVSDAVTGIKLLAQGKTINYEGAQVLVSSNPTATSGRSTSSFSRSRTANSSISKLEALIDFFSLFLTG